LAKQETGANIDYDEYRSHTQNATDAAEYLHVVLGLLPLKYVSDSFEELHAIYLGDRNKNFINKGIDRNDEFSG